MSPVVVLPLVALVAALASAVNSVAGGGTNISFPALVWLGVPALEANVTNAVGIWPGTLGGALGYRRELAAADRRWLWLVLPTLVGSALGAWLLLATPPAIFRALAPWLVLASSGLIAVEPILRRRLWGQGEPHRSGLWLLLAGAVQLGIAVYAGYFGAGLGFLLLVALSLLGEPDLQRANALKNFFAIAMKGLAVLVFLGSERLLWPLALAMAVGSGIGGWGGAALARRFPARTLRWIVIGLGALMGASLLLVG